MARWLLTGTRQGKDTVSGTVEMLFRTHTYASLQDAPLRVAIPGCCYLPMLAILSPW